MSDENGYTLWALSDCEKWIEVQKKALVKQHPLIGTKRQHNEEHNAYHHSERPQKRTRDTVEEDAEVLERIWSEHDPENHPAAPRLMKPKVGSNFQDINAICTR